MKKVVMICTIVFAVAVAASGVPVTIEFVNTTGDWHINQPGDPVDTISFDQDIQVFRAMGDTTDTVTGAYVHISDMVISGIPGGPYSLSTGTLSITDSDTPGGQTVTYLSGTINGGDLLPVGTIGVGYTLFQADISNVTIDNPIGSVALAVLENKGPDFHIALTGAIAGFKNVLDDRLPAEGSFSGAITVPEPATIALLAAGGLLLYRRKGQR